MNPGCKSADQNDRMPNYSGLYKYRLVTVRIVALDMFVGVFAIITSSPLAQFHVTAKQTNHVVNCNRGLNFAFTLGD